MIVITETARHAGTRAPSRGFTLTEIAIVLGIIGLILGAIWVAAAAVYNNMRVATANTELLQITQGLRAMYATSSTVDPGANMPGNLTYVHSGVFPTNALNLGTPSASTSALNPWSGNIYIAASTFNIANDSFAVAFDAIPSQACITLLTSSTGQGRDPGMFGVTAGAALAGGAVPAAPAIQLTPGQPLLASQAEGACPSGQAGSPGVAIFYFTLRAGTT